MFAKIKEFFFKKPAQVNTEVPYKVEAPTSVVESTSYKVPEPAATTPIPLMPAESVVPAKPAKKGPVKKSGATKAPAKPRAKKSVK